MFSRERFDRLWHLVDEDEASAREQILDELGRAAAALKDDGRELGAWEEHELGYAAWAINAGWLNLALHCIGKAYAVHEMTPDDYEAGFGFTQRGG